MKFKIFLVLVGISIVLRSNAQLTIKDVNLTEEYVVDDVIFQLSGGGMRGRFFLDLYVGGLYLKQVGPDAKEIVDEDEAMMIQLHIVSNLITSEEMISTIEDGFEKSTKGKQEQFRNDIDKLTNAFSEKIQAGDQFDIVYLPGTGVEVYKNNTKTVTVGEVNFKQALWGIWLGEDPVDADLKAGMLGQ